MDNYYRIIVMFKKNLSLITSQEIVKTGFTRFLDNSFEINFRYEVPIVFEFEEGIYENDCYLDDEGKNGYTSDSWFSVFFYSSGMDNTINCLSISPSNHPGRDFIIKNAEKLARCFGKDDILVDRVVYTVDSKCKPNELAILLKNGEGIIPEHNIHFILGAGSCGKLVFIAKG